MSAGESVTDRDDGISIFTAEEDVAVQHFTGRIGYVFIQYDKPRVPEAVSVTVTDGEIEVAFPDAAVPVTQSNNTADETLRGYLTEALLGTTADVEPVCIEPEMEPGSVLGVVADTNGTLVVYPRNGDEYDLVDAREEELIVDAELGTDELNEVARTVQPPYKETSSKSVLMTAVPDAQIHTGTVPLTKAGLTADRVFTYSDEARNVSRLRDIVPLVSEYTGFRKHLKLPVNPADAQRPDERSFQRMTDVDIQPRSGNGGFPTGVTEVRFATDAESVYVDSYRLAVINTASPDRAVQFVQSATAHDTFPLPFSVGDVHFGVDADGVTMVFPRTEGAAEQHAMSLITGHGLFTEFAGVHPDVLGRLLTNGSDRYPFMHLAETLSQQQNGLESPETE